MGEVVNIIDRRRFPRYPCTGAAEILHNGKRWGWGKVSDISRVGCYIETTHPLPTGAETELRLTVAGIALVLPANVVSSDTMYGMGMDFVVVPTEQWNKLPQVIERITDVDVSAATVQHDGTSHKEACPRMQAAFQYLQQAQKELREAMHEEGEHRAQALLLTENAIHEVKKACKWRDSFDITDPASMRSGFGRSCEMH